MSAPYAFVTLVSSDSYLPGALAVAGALKDVHPSPPVPPEVPFQTVCLVTPETVDVSTIKLLRGAFEIVIGVEVIGQEDEKGLKLLGRLDLNTVLTKLHIFRLTQFSKIIFLDADVLPIRPLSHLFSLPHEFSASPDVGWPDIFNSGVLVLSPGEEKFTQLTDLLASKGSWDGGDQGILNEWRGGNWNRLSFTYNTTPTAAYTYAPAYERFGAQISAIHFIGPNKPWNSLSYRAPFSSQPTPAADSLQQTYDYNTLVDRWYAVYDKHYRSHIVLPQPKFEVKRYESAWNENGPSTEPSVSATNGSTLSLEDLRRLAIEGMNASHPVADDKSDGRGEYKSMPLDGRVDLMRPKKPEAKDPNQSRKGKEKEKEKAEEIRNPEMLSNLSDSDELPHTPMNRHLSLQNESPPRWQTLPTPGPREVPPSPRPPIISLPPTTPTPHYFPHQHPQLTVHQPGQDQNSPTPTHVRLPPNPEAGGQHHEPQPQPQSTHHPHHPLQTPPATEAQSQPEPQPKRQSDDDTRPQSPPMLVWNPAIEPPPNTTPTPSAFPSDTYFPNIWDQKPSKQNDQTHRDLSPIPDSGGFFQPPPPSEIPESLLRQGHYRNVTGEDHLGSTPSPDRTKVKHVFPWEDKPRHLPGRVFPAADSPTPSLFLSPGSQTSTSEVPTTPEAKATRPVILSPLHGLPSSLTFTNAWDTVPSIQKYASRLVRPPQPRPLAPAFDDDGWRKGGLKSWENKAEASSRDGDVEDEGEDSLDEDAPDASLIDDESDRESIKSLQRRSRRGSTVSAAHTIIFKTEYKSFGVQTEIRETRSQGIQVSIEMGENEKDQSTLENKQARALLSTVGAPASLETSQANIVPDLPMNIAPSPAAPDAGFRSSLVEIASPPISPLLPLMSPPSIYLSRPSVKAAAQPKPISHPIHSPPLVMRQVSNESSVGSPASSAGPMSPPDGQPLASPLRKGGRVWDPARGVDLFKRGSEEVLARFLKMGSWEDETR
ncbi:hypothetical protein BDZ94DRAFT_1266657 [Collybia nuda]|uniref:glycogenin glucosyltransferase n=1 Tax=Collybia nuda TaxID=64659 RepID=A0A9P5Y0F9_9AGAR|nr:hypothetical protein BDZ94DRAFT_1266657 [Collybia nuda]